MRSQSKEAYTRPQAQKPRRIICSAANVRLTNHFTRRRDDVPVRSSTGTACSQRQPARYFTITHPFHPWRGRRFELLEERPQWGQWRVYYLTKSGRQAFFPAGWTDLGPLDPFVEQARGRAIARTEDLLELAGLLSEYVKEIKPQL